jgi:hypothetical protein
MTFSFQICLFSWLGENLFTFENTVNAVKYLKEIKVIKLKLYPNPLSTNNKPNNAFISNISIQSNLSGKSVA